MKFEFKNQRISYAFAIVVTFFIFLLQTTVYKLSNPRDANMNLEKHLRQISDVFLSLALSLSLWFCLILFSFRINHGFVNVLFKRFLFIHYCFSILRKHNFLIKITKLN